MNGLHELRQRRPVTLSGETLVGLGSEHRPPLIWFNLGRVGHPHLHIVDLAQWLCGGTSRGRCSKRPRSGYYDPSRQRPAVRRSRHTSFRAGLSDSPAPQPEPTCHPKSAGGPANPLVNLLQHGAPQRPRLAAVRRTAFLGTAATTSPYWSRSLASRSRTGRQPPVAVPSPNGPLALSPDQIHDQMQVIKSCEPSGRAASK